MFERKKLIVSVSKKAISLVEIILSTPKTVRPLAEYPYIDTSLAAVFTAIKNSVSAPIRIVLSEEYAYVVSFIPQSISKDYLRGEIKDKAQELIPEDLNNTAWDFKEILMPDPYQQGYNKKFIQVVATPQSLYTKISQAIASSGLIVEAIEPMSFSLARLTENQPFPHLIIHLGESILFIACWRGIVLATGNISNKGKPSAFPEFVSYVQDSYKVKLKTIIVCGKVREEEVAKLNFPGFTVGFQNLDPRVGMAIKADIQGEDERILNIVFQPKSSLKDAEFLNHKNRNFRTVALLALVVVSSLSFVATVFVKKGRPIKSTASSLLFSPTPSQENQNKYSVSILNGGLDPTVEVKLLSGFESQGLNIIRVGEADNKDYFNAVVSIKQPFKDEVKNRLDKLLKSYYSDFIIQSAPATSEADITIILGKNK